jgi:hypothetical protein
MIGAGERKGLRSSLLDAVVAVLREHALLIGFCALYIPLAFALATSNGLGHLFSLSLYPSAGFPALVVSGLVFALGYFFWLALVEKEKRPLSRLSGLIPFFSSWRGPLRIALPIIMVGLVGSTYTSVKGMIPLLHPFAFDVSFAEFDQMLHFGIPPWQITHAIFGSSTATVSINFVYNLWFLISWGFLLWQILNLGKPHQRMRFLLSFAMIWALLGSLGAVLMSSAGPVYYGYVTGLESPFAALMERLYAISGDLEAAGGTKIGALRVQEWLWGTYQDGATEVGSGISAMPSMHVAMAVLVALSGRHIGKFVGRALILYAVLIQIGSVHLGWHYAIDGYLSAILTVAIWKLAGVMVARWMPAEAPKTAISD